MQRALDKAVNRRVPGAVLVSRHGTRTIRVAAGSSDVKHKTRMRVSDRFRVGNITTSIVATATLQLVGEGKLSLDDNVETWLPGTIRNGAAITVRQLLNMRSGLFNYVEDQTFAARAFSGQPNPPWTPQELVAVAEGHAPLAAWSDCDTCYILLGQIIERATGHPLGDELRQRVFIPSGLRATGLDADAAITGRHAHGYERPGHGALKDVTAISPSYAWAAGAIVSTAGDVARFYHQLYGGKLLRADLLQAMQTTRPMSAELKGWGYGFGTIKKPIGCGTVYGHEGTAPGYSTYAYNSKNGARQAVIVMNAGDSTMEHEDNGRLQDLLAKAFCAGG
jgi:D-alanyl-D-alanine carboxypeptidase